MFEHQKTVIIWSVCHSMSDRENKRNERKEKNYQRTLFYLLMMGLRPDWRISHITYNFSTPPNYFTIKMDPWVVIF